MLDEKPVIHTRQPFLYAAGLFLEYGDFTSRNKMSNFRNGLDIDIDPIIGQVLYFSNSERMKAPWPSGEGVALLITKIISKQGNALFWSKMPPFHGVPVHSAISYSLCSRLMTCSRGTLESQSLMHHGN